MRKIIIHITFLSVILLIVSCERDIKNISLPDFEQKLVIHSYISPYDSTSLVRIGSNQRIYGDLSIKETAMVSNVTISNGEKEVILKEVLSGYIFTHTEMPVEEGKTYSLTVIDENGLKTEASCKVPIRRDFHPEVDTIHELLELPIEVLEIPGEENYQKMIRADVYLTDYPGENNYFRFASRYLLYDSTNLFLPFQEPYAEESEFVSDRGRDGERFFFNTVSVPDPYQNDSAFLVIYILNTDKEYYTYHQSLDNYSDGESPFIEVSPVYTNIEGGLGIFASYVVDSVVVRLK